MKLRWVGLFSLALVACKRAEPEPVSSQSAPVVAPVRRAAARAEKPPGAVVFAVIGDYGASTIAEANVARLVKGWEPEFVITTGDNNYPAGEAATIDPNIGQFYAEFIGGYHGRFGSGSQVNRFWPSPGNHDWVVGIAPYVDYFDLPGNERYYDVDLGLVHLYALDSDVHEPDGITPDSAQAKWLKGRLASSKSCYDIVYFHHPPYSTALHGPAVAMRWPFAQWGAEVVIAGHDHTYERFSVEGIPYFVNGLGGASKYEFAGGNAPETPESKFRYNEEFGAMRVTATRQEILYEFFTVDGKKRDTFSMPGRCSD